MRIPTLETERLRVRELTLEDLDAVHRLLDVALADVSTGSQGAVSREQRRDWLQWTVLGYAQLDLLYQPPYGERAVVSKDTGALVGLVGLVSEVNAFSQVPSLPTGRGAARASLNVAEVGLFWALFPEHRGQGLATEAVRALIGFAFEHLRVERLVATTSHDNAASRAVMRRLGMRLDRNPLASPPWLQVVGVLENPLSG